MGVYTKIIHKCHWLHVTKPKLELLIRRDVSFWSCHKAKMVLAWTPNKSITTILMRLNFTIGPSSLMKISIVSILIIRTFQFKSCPNEVFWTIPVNNLDRSNGLKTYMVIFRDQNKISVKLKRATMVKLPSGNSCRIHEFYAFTFEGLLGDL